MGYWEIYLENSENLVFKKVIRLSIWLPLCYVCLNIWLPVASNMKSIPLYLGCFFFMKFCYDMFFFLSWPLIIILRSHLYRKLHKFDDSTRIWWWWWSWWELQIGSKFSMFWFSIIWAVWRLHFVKDQFGYISDIWGKQNKVCDVDRLGGLQNAYQQEKDALLTSKGTNRRIDNRYAGHMVVQLFFILTTVVFNPMGLIPRAHTWPRNTLAPGKSGGCWTWPGEKTRLYSFKYPNQNVLRKHVFIIMHGIDSCLLFLRPLCTFQIIRWHKIAHIW